MSLNVIDLTADMGDFSSSEHLVISIDVGRINCATTIYDLRLEEVIYCQNNSIFDTGETLNPKSVAAKVTAFVKGLQNTYDVRKTASIALIESQPKFMLAGVNHAAFYDNGTIATAFFTAFIMLGVETKSISPKSVSSFHKIQRATRVQKKKAAVQLVTQKISDKILRLNNQAGEFFAQARKKDDLADSILQILYYLSTI